jgi:uncharacterized membrane protein YdjX (TVP38/TMEM64 family)
MAPQETNRLPVKKMIALLLFTGVCGAALVYYMWTLHPDFEYWQSLLDRGLQYLKAHPTALILSLAILPGIGFPISPLLILVGIVLGERYGILTACIMGLCAQAICTTWTYILSTGPLRKTLIRTILKNRPIPELTQSNVWRLGLILRITPGIPYALQNVVLGVMGMPFMIYMIISIPIQGLYAVGFMVTGGAIFKGNIGLAISAVTLLIVVILVTRIFIKRKHAYVE